MSAESSLTFPPREECRFLLLGSGRVMCTFIRLLMSNGFPSPIIITHPKEQHDRDRTLYRNSPGSADIYEDVFSVAAENDIELFETRDLNDEKLFDWLTERRPTVALSIGCRDIIRRRFLQFFDGKVLNYHAADLPRNGGAGGFSWQILQGDAQYVFGTLHMIDEGVDTGDVVLQAKKRVRMLRPYPFDLFRLSNQIAGDLFGEFLGAIGEGEEFTLQSQNRNDATYFPRLFTEKHGAIDWWWEAEHIERFVRAFGYPYPGAWTYTRAEKLHIGTTKLHQPTRKHHPFLAGLIFREYDGGEVEVATVDGSIIIVSLRSHGNEIPASSNCKIGHRLVTPVADIQGALEYRHVY